MEAQIPADPEDLTSVKQPVATVAGDATGDVAYLLRQVVSWIADVALLAPSNAERGPDA